MVWARDLEERVVSNMWSGHETRRREWYLICGLGTRLGGESGI